MKKRLTILLTIALLLTACAPPASPPAPTETVTATEKPTTTPVQPTATHPPTASPTPKSMRSASFTIIEKTVESRSSKKVDYSPASLGLSFPVGGQARTGEDGRARLDLAPDGTIIRVVPSTIFTLPALEEKDGNPFTVLELFLGQLYIILQGGELQVKTPSGSAAVSGSMLGVYYDPETGTMTATCLEGHCSLRNNEGIIKLVEGQAADIRDGILSHEPRQITDLELLNWLDNVPEVETLLERLSSLRDRINNLLEEGKRRRLPFP
jgi:hypothetical protein